MATEMHISGQRSSATPKRGAPRHFNYPTCQWVVAEEDLPRFGIKRGHLVYLEPVCSDDPFINGQVYLFTAGDGQQFMAEYCALDRGGFAALLSAGDQLAGDLHELTVVARHRGTWRVDPQEPAQLERLEVKHD